MPIVYCPVMRQMLSNVCNLAEPNTYCLASILSLWVSTSCNLNQNEEAGNTRNRAGGHSLHKEHKDSQAAPVLEPAYTLLDYAVLNEI